jgi:hypothetical protein
MVIYEPHHDANTLNLSNYDFLSREYLDGLFHKAALRLIGENIPTVDKFRSAFTFDPNKWSDNNAEEIRSVYALLLESDPAIGSLKGWHAMILRIYSSRFQSVYTNNITAVIEAQNEGSIHHLSEENPLILQQLTYTDLKELMPEFIAALWKHNAGDVKDSARILNRFYKQNICFDEETIRVLNRASVDFGIVLSKEVLRYENRSQIEKALKQVEDLYLEALTDNTDNAWCRLSAKAFKEQGVVIDGVDYFPDLLRVTRNGKIIELKPYEFLQEKIGVSPEEIETIQKATREKGNQKQSDEKKQYNVDEVQNLAYTTIIPLIRECIKTDDFRPLVPSIIEESYPWMKHFWAEYDLKNGEGYRYLAYGNFIEKFNQETSSNENFDAAIIIKKIRKASNKVRSMRLSEVKRAYQEGKRAKTAEP